MLKLLDCDPAGTVMLAGTVAEGLLLVIVTVVAAWAIAVSVTVPVEELPPVTAVGFNDKLATPRNGVAVGVGGGGVVVGVGVGGGGVGVGGGTPPVVLVKTSINGAPAPPSTKAMSGLASAFQSPARIMMPPLLTVAGRGNDLVPEKCRRHYPCRICSKPFVPSPIVRAMSRKPSRL